MNCSLMWIVVLLAWGGSFFCSCSSQHLPGNSASSGNSNSTTNSGTTPTPAATVSISGTVLSPGDTAIVGYTTGGTQNDQFAFVLLKAVVQGTQINISDMNWDGYEFAEADGGVIVWTTDKAYPTGTVVQTLPTSNGGSGSTHSYAVNIYSGGATYTNVTGAGAQSGTYAFSSSSPIQVTTVANTGGGLTGLSTSGDQLIIYQGSTALGAAASSVAFVSGFNFGAAWSTGTPTPVPNPTWDLTYYAKNGGHEGNSYLPNGLTEGVNALAIASSYSGGGYYDCSNGSTGSQSFLLGKINNAANWHLPLGSGDLPIPVLSSGVTVQ